MVAAFFVLALVIERELASARGDEQQEDETEQDRRVAAIGYWIEALGRMRDEIGERHVAREQESYWTREETENQKDAAADFQEGRDQRERGQAFRTSDRKAKQFLRTVRKIKQCCHNAKCGNCIWLKRIQFFRHQ